MASSLNICYGGRGGGVGTCAVNLRGMSFCSPETNQMASFGVAMTTVRRKRGCRETIPISMSVKPTKMSTMIKHKEEQKKSVSFENVIDKWMKESVVEIVKNLREAPLLVHVYNDNSNGNAPARLKTEKAVPENWQTVKYKWENGTTPLPEGVIFVERLKPEGDLEPEREGLVVDSGGECENTNAWGIVVQARGENCGPACYLLKTSRVGSGSGLGSGLGLCCTHFCLVKVKSFRETAEAQFKNCWLLNGNRID